MRRLPSNVQRDAPFYRATVSFRNAVEQMILRHLVTNERPAYLDRHLFWGFASGDGDGFDADDDGLAPSRVPLHPFGGAGAAGVAIDQPDAPVDDPTERAKLSA